MNDCFWADSRSSRNLAAFPKDGDLIRGTGGVRKKLRVIDKNDRAVLRALA